MGLAKAPSAVHVERRFFILGFEQSGGRNRTLIRGSAYGLVGTTRCYCPLRRSIWLSLNICGLGALSMCTKSKQSLEKSKIK